MLKVLFKAFFLDNFAGKEGSWRKGWHEKVIYEGRGDQAATEQKKQLWWWWRWSQLFWNQGWSVTGVTSSLSHLHPQAVHASQVVYSHLIHDKDIIIVSIKRRFFIPFLLSCLWWFWDGRCWKFILFQMRCNKLGPNIFALKLLHLCEFIFMVLMIEKNIFYLIVEHVVWHRNLWKYNRNGAILIYHLTTNKQRRILKTLENQSKAL